MFMEYERDERTIMMDENTKSIVASNLTVAFHISSLRSSIINAQARAASGVSVGPGRHSFGPTPEEIVKTFRAIMTALDAPEVAEDEDDDDSGEDAQG